jgi:hypothetical protein
MGDSPRKFNREPELSGYRPSPPLPGFLLVRTIKRRIYFAAVEHLRVTVQMAPLQGKMGAPLTWNIPT